MLFRSAALRLVPLRRLRALALVRADRLTAEGLLDVLNRLAGPGMHLQSVLRAVPPLAALYVRDCAALDWRSLQWLGAVGIVLKVWEHGREVDASVARVAKKARFP